MNVFINYLFEFLCFNLMNVLFVEFSYFFFVLKKF